MTTPNKVSSAATGTLKTKHQKQSSFRTFFSVAALVLVSLATMAFNTEDTTRKHIDADAADSCCSVTFAYGQNRITIANFRELNSTVLINGTDVQTFVNNAKAYSFKQVNFNGVAVADQVIDVQFTAAEMESRRKAALLTQLVQPEATAADAELNAHFNKYVAGPAFSNNLQNDARTTDMQLDAVFNDEINLQRQVVAFSRRVAPAADEQLDWQIRASLLQPIRSVVAIGADLQIDQLLHNEVKLQPRLALEADRLMDAQIKK